MTFSNQNPTTPIPNQEDELAIALCARFGWKRTGKNAHIDIEREGRNKLRTEVKTALGITEESEGAVQN